MARIVRIEHLTPDEIRHCYECPRLRQAATFLGIAADAMGVEGWQIAVAAEVHKHAPHSRRRL